MGQMGTVTHGEGACLVLSIGPAVGAGVGTIPKGWRHLPPAAGRRDGDDGDPRLGFFSPHPALTYLLCHQRKPG